MMNELVVLNDNNVPTTSSLKVAENFGKRHDNVLRDIEVIINTLEANEIDALNFEEISVPDSYGRPRRAFEMDRNAYSQLVGSFTGEKSTIFRKRYADAFDAMEAALVEKEQAQAFDPTKLSKMEILKMALESESERLRLEHRVAEDAPKVEGC